MNDSDALVAGEILQVPYSAGSAPPRIPLPLGATDCHHHIFDPRFPEHQGVLPLEPAYRTLAPDVHAYRLFKRRLGLTRSVLIAPSNYGDDNACLIDALQAFGPDAARGVAIVAPEVSDTELDRLHRHGVRGIRVYLAKARAPDPAQLQRLAHRASDRGWHLQLVGDRHTEVLADWQPLLARLPCRIVIDHLGFVPQPGGGASTTATTVRNLLDGGNAYVKLSAVYVQSTAGYPDYQDVDPWASELVRIAPDRMLWGSDWPHVGATTQKPDGARLVDRLAVWAADPAVRRRILVDNPAALYWAD